MDKKINVKITANASKFKKAITDATKSLDKMKKSSDKISKSKIDKNLSKQFKNITKSSKKVDKQLQQNAKSLNNINKIKLSNITKQFTNMDKTVKNNQKTLQSLQKVLNNLKAKSIESVNKALTTMSKGASTVSKGFSNVKNVLSSISSKTIETLTRSITTLNNKCPAVSKAFNNIKTSLSGIKSSAFNALSSSLSNIKSKASTVGQGFSNLKTKISDIARASLDKLVNSTTRLNTEGTKSGNIFTNFSNKIKSLTGSALGGLSSKLNVVTSGATKMGSTFTTTAVIGSAAFAKLSNKVNDTTSKYNSNRDAMLKAVIIQQKLATDTAKLAEEYKKLDKAINKNLNDSLKLMEAENLDAEAIRKNKEETAKLTKKKAELEQKERKLMQSIDQNVKKYADLSQKDKTLEKELRSLVDKYNELARAQGKATLNFDKLVNGEQKAIRGTQTLRSATGNLREELKNAAKYTINLSNEQKKAEETTKSFSDKMKDLGKSLKDTFEKLNKGDFSGAFSSLKNVGKAAFTAMPGWAKAATVLAISLKKLYDAGKNRFFEGLSNIKNTLQPVIDIVKKFGQSLKSAFEMITGTRIDLTSLMQVGVNFEYQMKKVGSIARSNDKQLQKLVESAKKYGGSTQFTATQVGEAFEYMAMAGYSTDEMLASIEDTLNLAIISGSDLGTVSDIVTDGLTALGMSAADTGEFVDKMTATITSANTTVELFGGTLSQVGALAGSLGVNMTDLSTATGLMANAGVKGTRAGVSLKNVLANMEAPTKKQEKALKQLGLTADENGSYLKTNADGNVDLEATMKSLMEATKDMDKTEKAALLTKVAGKEAIAGLMSIMNQGEEAWDELSDTIENSTGKVQYWNECMNLAGKSGEEATKLIEDMKKVFEETEAEASALGLSTEDLANAIALLGDDGEVTTQNVKDLLKVIESMNSATGEAEKKWRALDVSGKNLVNTGYDYDATVAAITADTQGMTQAQKEELTNRLKNVKSYKKALKIATDYQKELNKQNGTQINLTDTIKRNTFANMSYADKLKYLRDAYKELGPAAFNAKMEEFGLGDSIDEVNEIMNMSDKEFNAYTKNLKTVQSMSEQLKGAMDEVTKAGLLSLASAIENVAISAFEKFKPTIQDVTGALNEFFNTWHNGEDNEFTFGGLEKGLSDLENKVKSAIPNISKAITDGIKGLKTFVTEGSLDSILQIGTDIITGICDGIINSKEELTTAISEGIRKICDWIHVNKDQVKEAGLTILQAIGDGIKENRSEIETACNDIYEVINAWTATHQGNMTNLGMTLGGPFMKGFLDGAKQELQATMNGIWDSLIAEIKNLPSKIKSSFNLGDFLKTWASNASVSAQNIGVNIMNGIIEGLGIPNPFDAISNVVKSIINWFKELLDINSPSRVMRDEVGKNIIDGIVEGLINGIKAITDAVGKVVDAIKEGFGDIWNKIFGKEDNNKELINIDSSKLKENEAALKSLGNTAEIVRGQLREAFTSIANIARNQFVNMANIARNQFTNISNIIKNQATNARNAATSQFISLKKVISTQLSEARQVVVSKMISIAKVVNTQSSNARNNATRHFISLRKVIQTQMSEAYSSVSSYMNKIASATNRTLNTKVNVTKTVTTVDAGGGSAIASAFSSLNAMALSGSGLTYAAAGISSGVGSSSNTGINSNNAMYFELPVYLDGKVVAKTTARYMNNELTILDKKNSRKRGKK